MNEIREGARYCEPTILFNSARKVVELVFYDLSPRMEQKAGDRACIKKIRPKKQKATLLRGLCVNLRFQTGTP
ncbi:hypothetical protein RB2150_00405 [Rhodobacterales bacterium HTCC2150]|nr:hypothetical protein RB2150_00405 [Rhodobacterales bacterium HTCC2150] [Rhodobacteraceae bacterium HTCC2150]